MNPDTLSAWAQANIVPLLVLLAWVAIGAIGERLDKGLEEAKSPRLAGIRDVFHALGLTPSRLLRGLLAVVSVRSGAKLPDDDDLPPLAGGGGGGPSDAPSSKAGGAAMRFAVLAVAICGLVGCADPLGTAIRSSNIALEVGQEAADVLSKTCTKPMEVLAAKALGAPTPEARAAVAAQAADLASRCDPAVGTHESLRAAHRALRVVILGVQAGKSVDVAGALSRLALAAAELERAIEALAGLPVGVQR